MQYIAGGTDNQKLGTMPEDIAERVLKFLKLNLIS